MECIIVDNKHGHHNGIRRKNGWLTSLRGQAGGSPCPGRELHSARSLHSCAPQDGNESVCEYSILNKQEGKLELLVTRLWYLAPPPPTSKYR